MAQDKTDAKVARGWPRGLVGVCLMALARRRGRPSWSWVLLSALGWALSFAGPQLGLGPIAALVAWGAGLFLLSAALLARWLHPTLLVPSLSMGMSTMAVASVLSLGTGYEQAIDALTAKTQGDALVTKQGRDFSGYEKLARGLESLDEVEVAVPFVHVEGLAQAKAPGESLPRSKAMVLRGVPQDALLRSRIFEQGRKNKGLGAPKPAQPHQKPELWLGRGLARSIGATLGEPVRLTVWSREARREQGVLHYDYAPRSRLYRLAAVVETGDQAMDEQLAVSALSAAQALAHGRAWVTGVDLEWSDPSASGEPQRLAAVSDWLHARSSLYRVSSWRESPERDEQRRRFLALGAVLSFGLMSASSVGLILGVLVLLRLRAQFFRGLHAMGASLSQQRQVLAALLLLSFVVAAGCFGLWWALLICCAPDVAFHMDILGSLTLAWSLSTSDLGWLLGWLALSYLASYVVLRRQLQAR